MANQYETAIKNLLVAKGIALPDEKEYKKGGKYYETPVSVFTEIKPKMIKLGVADENANVSRFSKAFIKADDKAAKQVLVELGLIGGKK